MCESVSGFVRIKAASDQHRSPEIVAGELERIRCPGFIDTGQRRHHAPGATGELFVRNPHVDHQPAVDEPAAQHDRGRQHVKRGLLRGARLHPSRSGHDLGAGIGDDRVIGGSQQRRAGIIGDGDGQRAAAARRF
jgi:hypothetical protein